MGRGWNQGIVGDCLFTLDNNNVRLHRTITLHLTMSSPTGQGFQAGVFACGTNAPFTTALGTRIIPDQYIYPNGSTFRAPGQYNQSSSTASLVTYDSQPVYFCEADLEFWRQRPLYQPNIYMMYASGPAVQATHSWARLRRKRADRNTYIGRYEYDWMDAASPIRPTTTSTTTPEPGPGTTTTPAPEPPPCEIRDWLIMQHPASPLWTSVEEPFTCSEIYETNGTFPPRESALGGENFVPFCDPLPVRSADGTVLGSYVGYCFVHMFGQATMSFPVQPYLPRDPNSPLPNPPYVNPRQAFYSLETLVYLASDNELLASPRIARKRWWLYSSAGQSGGFNWHTPYFTMALGSMNSMWQFDVLFPYYYGGQEAIKFNLSDTNVLVTG